jgi:hypothetical protein
MRSGVQNFSSSLAGAVSSGVPLALGDALGVSGGADGEAGGVVVAVLVEGDADGVPGAVGVTSSEGEADRDGPSGELLVGAVTGVGAESAHADVEMKVAAIAVAAARLCLSLKFPPCSGVHGPWSAVRSVAISDPIHTHPRT